MELFRKIEIKDVLDSCSVRSKFGEFYRYYLINVPDFRNKDGKIDKVHYRRLVLFQALVSWGIQPLTGIVSYDGELYNPNIDGWSMFESVAKKIDKVIDSADIRFECGGYLLDNLNYFYKKNVLKIFGGTSPYANPNGENMELGVINQKYITNSLYVSLFNVILFGEMEFWNTLSPVDDYDLNEIDKLLNRSKTPLFDRKLGRGIDDDVQDELNIDYIDNLGVRISLDFMTKFWNEKHKKSIFQGG